MKWKKDKELIIILILLLVIIIINSILLVKKVIVPKQELENSNKAFEIAVQQKKDEQNKVVNENTGKDELQELKSMSEYDRIHYYFTKYINHIQNKQYQQAYDLLYPEFKQQYFPTLESYTQYITNLYPKFVAFDYKDFIRQGYIYVIKIQIIDPINGNKGQEEKTQRIIIRENNFNNFVLSFQVI